MFSHLQSTVLTGIKVMCVMIFYAVVAVPTREIKTISISNPVFMITSFSLHTLFLWPTGAQFLVHFILLLPIPFSSTTTLLVRQYRNFFPCKFCASAILLIPCCSFIFSVYSIPVISSIHPLIPLIVSYGTAGNKYYCYAINYMNIYHVNLIKELYKQLVVWCSNFVTSSVLVLYPFTLVLPAIQHSMKFHRASLEPDGLSVFSCIFIIIPLNIPVQLCLFS